MKPKSLRRRLENCTSMRNTGEYSDISSAFTKSSTKIILPERGQIMKALRPMRKRWWSNSSSRFSVKLIITGICYPNKEIAWQRNWWRFALCMKGQQRNIWRNLILKLWRNPPINSVRMPWRNFLMILFIASTFSTLQMSRVRRNMI